MSMRYLILLLLLPLGLASFNCARAQPDAASTAAEGANAASTDLVPIRDFARHARLSTPRLSPDGKHLLVRMDSDTGDHHALVVFQLSDMSMVSKLNMPIYELPLNPVWVNNKWIALEIGRSFGSLDAPMNTGQVISSNITGDKQRYLFGSQNEGRRARTRGSDQGFGFIVGVPDERNGHVYVRAEPWGREDLSVLYNIDAVHNTRNLLAHMDEHGMGFLVSPDGQAAWAFGTNEAFDYVAFRKRGDHWAALDLDKYGEYFIPLTYTADHKHVYAVVDQDGGPTSLIRVTLDGSKRKVLAEDSFASIGDIQWSAPPERPFAVIPRAGVPRVEFMDADSRDAKLYRALSKAFPGGVVDFINFSQDRGKLLFYVSSDRDPGAYYLINLKGHKVRRLFNLAPWIDPARMAERVPFRFKASDGMLLEGILTFPLDAASHKNLPMVLVPHGGPYGVRDSWYFDWDAQFLASRGYLVLQVNFRGSGGRGADFRHAGYRKWGTRIQRDLIDGVKWTIEHGYADPDRICVYGASFGGYSALMSVIRAPDLFQCAVGYAGIYDLQMMYEDADSQAGAAAVSYFDTVLGTDEATRAANSPVDLAEKIEVPVFLVHGKADKRAPFEQAEAMRAALKDAGKPFEWMAFDDEGHGFFTEAHRVALLTKLQAFLEANIGSPQPASTKAGDQAE